MNAAIKRAVDIVGAIVGIVLFSPIMLIVALLIKLTSPGPIIFCQERVGLHNRPFKMYKFRSMTVQDPSKEKSRWTTKGDARVTLIGKSSAVQASMRFHSFQYSHGGYESCGTETGTAVFR